MCDDKRTGDKMSGFLHFVRTRPSANYYWSASSIGLFAFAETIKGEWIAAAGGAILAIVMTAGGRAAARARR